MTRLSAAGAAVLLTAGLVATVSSSAVASPPSSSHPTPVVLYSSDGMRPDLMQRYAAQGLMPTYASLMRCRVSKLVTNK